MSDEMYIDYIAGKAKAPAKKPAKKPGTAPAKKKAYKQITGVKSTNRRRKFKASAQKPAIALKRLSLVSAGIASGALTIKIVDEKMPKIPKIATRAGVMGIGVIGVMKGKKQEIVDFSLGFGGAGAVSLVGNIVSKPLTLGGGGGQILISGEANQFVLKKNMVPYAQIPSIVSTVY